MAAAAVSGGGGIGGLKGLSAGLGIVGGELQGFGAMLSARAAMKDAYANIGIIEEKKQASFLRQSIELQTLNKQLGLVVGDVKASFASRGVEVSKGSAESEYKSTVEEANKELRVFDMNFTNERREYMFQQQALRRQASNARTQGILGAISGTISGLASGAGALA